MDSKTQQGFVWHELMSRDPDASARFYGSVAGVTMEALGGDGDEYWLIIVDGRPVAGMTGPRGVAEGWPSGGPEGHWVAYLGTDDVDGSAERARALGGEVLLEPVDVPGWGRAAVLRDPDGATFGIFQPVAS
jgi:predicted enzyme related to lactoylglutathione lyase